MKAASRRDCAGCGTWGRASAVCVPAPKAGHPTAD